MKKKQIHCPYCGAKASLRPASAVYGTATKVPDSYLYVCDRYPRCDSYVGAHKRTKEPMGTLANGDLRNKRIQAHKAFDWMWKSGLMTNVLALMISCYFMDIIIHFRIYKIFCFPLFYFFTVS